LMLVKTFLPHEKQHHHDDATYMSIMMMPDNPCTIHFDLLRFFFKKNFIAKTCQTIYSKTSFIKPLLYTKKIKELLYSYVRKSPV